MAIVKQALFQNSDDAEEKVEMLLDMKMEILWRWYHYINMDYEDDIIYHTFHGTKGAERFLENEVETPDFKDKRKELENLITVNSCLIDLLKDACEFNMELDYISNIHSALSVISEKQIESLKLVADLNNNF